MANENQTNNGKRRWYSNLADLYRVTKRSYRWVSWVMLVVLVVPLLISIAINLALSTPTITFVLNIIFAIGIGLLLDTLLLTQLGNKAMYAQLEGVKGGVYAVIKSIKRGWIIEEQPVAFNRRQDMVWRMVGRAGIVLISEGPASRVGELLHDESRKCQRVANSVPIHTIQCGTNKGQVRIGKLMSQLRKLKKKISKEEVPVVANRLQSLSAKSAPIPKGVDPSKIRVNRRQLRGK